MEGCKKYLMSVLAVALVAGTFSVPMATAHQCTVEEGGQNESDCNTRCKEGEEHEHTVTHHHENGWEQDENHIHYECTSHKSEEEEKKTPCSTPKVLGLCLIDDLVTRLSSLRVGLAP